MNCSVKWYKKFGILLLSICFSMSLFMNMGIPRIVSELSYTGLFEIKYSLTDTYFSATLFAIFSYYFGVKIESRCDKKIRGLKVCSFIIAILWAMGKNYSMSNSLEYMYLTEGQIVKNVIYVIGATYFCVYTGKLLWMLFESKRDICVPAKITNFVNRHPFLTPVAIILPLVIVQLIISYPGAMTYDAGDQLIQYFSGGGSSHHPPVHTVLMGWCVELGIFLGSANMGMFIYVLLQVSIFVLVFSYLIYSLTKWNVPNYVILSVYAAILFSPFYIIFACTLIKDSIYSYMSLLFCIELVYLIRLKENFWRNKFHLSMYIISIIGTMLMRNNGTYIVYPTVVILLLLILKEFNIYKSVGTALKKCIITVAPIILANLILSGVMSANAVTDHSIVDALSLPVQQTARYVTMHGDEVTPEEKEVLSKVFDYTVLETGYNPKISDPIKNCYNRETTNEELIQYFKVWFKQFLKHPQTYVDATLNQNYTMIYPFKEYDGIFYSRINLYNDENLQLEGYPVYDIEALKEIKDIRNSLGYFSFSAPIIGLFSNYAVYNILLIYLIMFAINKKMWEFLFISIPIVFSDLIVLAAPLVDPRYAFPVFYAMPLLLGYYLYRNEQMQRSKDE